MDFTDSVGDADQLAVLLGYVLCRPTNDGMVHTGTYRSHTATMCSTLPEWQHYVRVSYGTRHSLDCANMIPLGYFVYDIVRVGDWRDYKSYFSFFFRLGRCTGPKLLNKEKSTNEYVQDGKNNIFCDDLRTYGIQHRRRRPSRRYCWVTCSADLSSVSDRETIYLEFRVEALFS